MMQTDVKAGVCSVAGSTAVTAYRSRVKAIALTTTSAGGAITITDGNGGPTLFAFTPALIAESTYMLFPGEGILAQTGIYVKTGNGPGATVFYG